MMSGGWRRRRLRFPVGYRCMAIVLDLEVDTGEGSGQRLRGLIRSLGRKRYHRLRDGSLLRLDDSMPGAGGGLGRDSGTGGAKATQGMPSCRCTIYLDGALSGRPGVRFPGRAFRRISRSFHAVKDSDLCHRTCGGAAENTSRLPLAAYPGRLRHGASWPMTWAWARPCRC